MKTLERISAASSNGHSRQRGSSVPESYPVGNGHSKPVIITGGAGFIGTNLANRLLASGQRVVLLDNLSRPGAEKNLSWLIEQYGDMLDIQVPDIRNLTAVKRVVKHARQIFHFAAQVAVTSSLTDPIADFEINARGTLNVLEAIRDMSNPPPVAFTSTNKVYGALNDLVLESTDKRYLPKDQILRENGLSEQRPLCFHSPYGCSKGAADQYVLDYAHTYHLPAFVFRMSCIYGPHQFGNEDQGWIAHFLRHALAGQPLTIYGDGKQVRDVLYVEDLVDALLLAQRNINSVSGHAFNIGGGPKNTLSLLELIALIAELHNEIPAVCFENWRTADQRYYVSDTEKFRSLTGWEAKVGVREGVKRLYDWMVKEAGSARLNQQFHRGSLPPPKVFGSQSEYSSKV